MTPLMVRFKSVLNSFMMAGRPMVMPPIIQPARKEKRQTVMKATIFFHFGQLRGSLTWFEGEGTRIISSSVFLISLCATDCQFLEFFNTKITVNERHRPLPLIEIPQRLKSKVPHFRRSSFQTILVTGQ
jgi:hypothetical protein